jgi:putative FmdB family regulatory protein
MPLYEYQCETCGRFEKIVKFSDPPLEVCPTCGGKIQKLFSSPAIQFKGSGFYITDYARKSSADASGGKSGSSDSASSDAASSDKASSDKSSGEKSSTEKSSSDSSSSAASTPATTTSSKD